MRIIGGTHRGRRLRTVEGLAVRPTSDRLRETLFNILGPRVKGSAFIDICAGSGAVGLEALSRGASHATFVDRSRKACSAIESNISALHLSDRATVINRDASAGLKRLADERSQFDIAFVDPPYGSPALASILAGVVRGRLLAPDGILVIEHRIKDPVEPEQTGLGLYRSVRQGQSALAFFAPH